MITKTIRMPKALAKKWLSMLRSGKYKQAGRRLGNTKEGMCCLGVLALAAEGRCRHPNDEVPSTSFLEKHGITFKCLYGDSTQNPGVYYNMEGLSAAELNDTEGLSFSEIADVLADHMETY